MYWALGLVTWLDCHVGKTMLVALWYLFKWYSKKESSWIPLAEVMVNKT